MDVTTLLILGIVAAVLVVGAFFGLIFLSILTYVVKNVYPLARRAGLWASRLHNFLPLLILAVVLLVIIILLAVVGFKLPLIAMLLLLLILLIFLVALILVDILLLLAILVYIIRAARWIYIRWQGLFAGFWPQIMKLKIKHDVGKDKDKDWTTHFTDMRKKLSDEAEQTRRRISGGGK